MPARLAEALRPPCPCGSHGPRGHGGTNVTAKLKRRGHLFPPYGLRRVVLAALAVLWYGAETALIRTAGWHLAPLYPLHAAIRDLLLPGLWFDAWAGTGFVWRGHPMSIAADVPPA